MSPQQKNLDDLIRQVRSHILARKGLQGACITLAVAAATLLLSAWLADSFGHRAGVLLLLRILPFAAMVASCLIFIVRPLSKKVSEYQVARLIEERCALSERLITAVEFSDDTREASPAIVNRLITDAGNRCNRVTLEQVVDPRYSYAYGTAAASILLVLAAAVFIGPASLSQGMSALYSPGGEGVSANATFINVTPGTARVPRGSDQKIKASLNGFDSNTVQVFIRKEGAGGWGAFPMEPARSAGDFQYLVFNIQDSITYYVESKGIRSPEFSLEVADLPFVKQLDLVLNFPAYTRLANKRIENGGEVAALKGTVVTVNAQLSAKARGARIVLSDGSKVEMTEGADNLFAGQFTVKENGSYRIELTSETGERYNGSNEFDITLLEDQPPSVMIDKPGRDMKVTSIQEVFAQARAEDDYGIASIELYYSVNGGEEKRIGLQDLKSESAKNLSGAHTFFLEEYSLQPGDFISYYAKARDNAAGNGGQEATSDIYFLEVRPFDREFRQAQQQGGGGGGGEQDSNALTRRQREIIAATFRVQRELQGYTPEEKEENFDAVTLSQEKLKVDTDQLAERIRRRMGDQLRPDSDFGKLVENLTQASKEMVVAAGELKGRKTKEALPPEQRALQQLLRAEAIFREIQVARGQQQGGGGQQNAEELADLFELQLDKMKNQYETVQREQQASQDQKKDELARKLEELARRQQQQAEQRMRAEMQQGGGGGGGSQRQQQEMIDEARKMARELERLSRERRDPKLEETARQLQQAADEMQRSQASSSSASGMESAAQAMRALERLEQARRSLDSSKRAGGQQSVQRLRQQAEEALKRQEEISRSVDELARQEQAGGASEEKKDQLAERKQALAEQLSGLEKDIDQTARGLGQEKQQAGDQLREAAGAIRRNRIPERIRQNSQLIENGWYDQARERERTIKGNIEDVLKNLRAAEGNASRPGQAEGLEDALNRARELADNLDSLRRRMESGREQEGGSQGQDQARNGRQQQGQQAQNGERQGGQQNGRQQSGQQQNRQQGQQGRNQQGRNQQAQNGQNQQGQQAGGGQEGGQQQGGQQAGQRGQRQQGQQGGREASSDSPSENPNNGGGGPPRPGARQIESELRQRLAEAEDLRRRLGRNSDIARDLNRAIEQLRRIDPNAFSDMGQLAMLKSEVIEPLRQIELAIAQKLQARLGKNGPGALSDGDAPDRYRKMIEDYYRRLSVRSAEVKP